MAISFSKHASYRLAGRMSGIVTAREILAAVYEAGPMGLGETAVVVKHLSRAKIVRDDDGSVSEGDTVIAVYRRSGVDDPGCITTIELRGSWQKQSARWALVIDLTI